MAWIKNRWVWVYTLLPIVVVGTGILVSRIIEDAKERVALYAAIVATFGIIVTGGKNLYDLWDKEREKNKKEDDRREKLSAEVQFRPFDVSKNVLGVDVYNCGLSPIAIKSVLLIITATGKSGFDQFVCDMEDGNSSYQFKLEPKSHICFHQYCFTEVTLSLMLGLRDDEMHLLVNSYQGEVIRVHGSEILAVIHRNAEINQ